MDNKKYVKTETVSDKAQACTDRDVKWINTSGN